MRYPPGTLSTLPIHVALDEIEAVTSRLRAIADQADTYRQQALYQSVADLHLDMAQSMEACWKGFEEVLESLDE